MTIFRNLFSKDQDRPKWLIPSIITTIIAIIIIITISIININNRNQSEPSSPVQITNFSRTNIPERYQSEIESKVYHSVSKLINYMQLSSVKATVRDQDPDTQTRNSANEVSFLLDLPDIQQSLRVFVTYTNGNDLTEEILIACPFSYETLYPDSECIAETAIEQLEKYIPHIDKLDTGEEIILDIWYYTSGMPKPYTPYLAVQTKACRNQDILNASLKRTTEWLKSINLDPINYYMEAIDICNNY